MQIMKQQLIFQWLLLKCLTERFTTLHQLLGRIGNVTARIGTENQPKVALPGEDLKIVFQRVDFIV